MNKQEQRIAIVEACPCLPVSMGDYIWSNTGYIINPFREIIIDPINDLNAMHEAEKVLERHLHATGDTVAFYYRELSKLMAESPYYGKHDVNPACIIATAAQRAEAFLKTLNLWK